jgi:hypothetical protein
MTRDAASRAPPSKRAGACARQRPAPATAPRRAAAEPADSAHPDQVEAARRLGDALGRALGTEVRVAPRGDGYRVVLELADPGAAEALAERLGALEAA